tara:strand:+ start:1318 stop:1599 length:282 start_codon:yes stop_codon:yes gene_type:complete
MNNTLGAVLLGPASRFGAASDSNNKAILPRVDLLPEKVTLKNTRHEEGIDNLGEIPIRVAYRLVTINSPISYWPIGSINDSAETIGEPVGVVP